MKNKRKVSLFNIILIVLLVLFLFVMYEVFLEEVIPCSRQFFLNYESFQKQTERVSFQRDIPTSAHDAKYYVYEGMLQDKCAYHMSFSSEDYEKVKEERYAHYAICEEIGKGYRYKDGAKKYVSLEQMKSQKIDFLDKIITEEEIAHYYLFCYYFSDSGDIYSYNGVLCKDESCEIIEFGFYGPLGEKDVTQEYESHDLQYYIELLLVGVCTIFCLFCCTRIKPVCCKKNERG